MLTPLASVNVKEPHKELISTLPPLPQVNAEFIKSGEFSLERMGVTYKAKAHLKTPFDPENKRVKGLYA